MLHFIANSVGLQQDVRRFSAFFVAPTLRAPCGVLASARLCCLSRVPPAVCPSLLESATTTVCTSFLQSLSTYVHTPTPHSVLRFRPAPKTPDLHTFNLPLTWKIKKRTIVYSVCEITFSKIYLPCAKKYKLLSHQVFGVFALEVNKIRQATPSILRREMGMCVSAIYVQQEQ